MTNSNQQIVDKELRKVMDSLFEQSRMYPKIIRRTLVNEAMKYIQSYIDANYVAKGDVDMITKSLQGNTTNDAYLGSKGYVIRNFRSKEELKELRGMFMKPKEKE